MSRLGCLMLLLFAAAIGLFVLITKRDHDAPAPSATAAQPGFAPPPEAARPGGLAIPVAGVQPAQLTDTWGDPRSDGARQHHAIDIVAGRGAPVVAASAGVVEKLFESRDGGHTIYIRPDPTTVHYYAHLDSYAPDLREGITVMKGQQIGKVGATGDADMAAPHLHFEIKRMAPGDGWWQGTEIDPYPILTGKG